ncbi:MAG TPA: F0F1 ATP synthase subunit A [Anaerolineaceae bacterium]
MENTRKWRWGANRWIVLACIILMVIVATAFMPVRPHIFVAPEKLSHEPLFTLPVIGDFYVTNTLTTMLIVYALVFILALAVRNGVRRGSLVPSGIVLLMEWVVEVVYNMTESTVGRHARKVFPFFMTILLVVLVSNLLALVPGMESIGILEPTSDHGNLVQQITPGIATVVNTEAHEGEQGFALVPFFRGMSTDLNFTVALALISVIMTQVLGFQANGPGYILRFFNVRNLFTKPFFGAMDFLVSLLELISEFAKILSFSFRLFGNMFAGMVLTFLIISMVPWFAPAMIMMFEFFIGLIQAFVFGMLTMVFMSQAVAGHGDGEHEHA